MSLRRLIHHFKVAVVSTVVVAVAALICGVFWLNEKGFGGQWGDRIAAELSARGIHAEFSEARFSPLHGIIVRDVIVYRDQDQDPANTFATIPRLLIDIDRAKALRGELLLRKLELEKAELNIPVSSGVGEPVIARIKDLFGDLSIDRQGRLLLQEARGTLAGMEFHLNAELDNFELDHLSGQARDSADQSRSEFMQLLFAELSQWSFPQSAPPKLDLRLSGNLKKPASIRTAFTLEADVLSRSDYDLKDVVLSGTFLGRHLAVKRLHFSDGAGAFTTNADYDLRAREGRYTVTSSIHLARMLRAFFDQHVLDDLLSAAPKINGSGTFQLAPDGSFSTSATGSLDIPPFQFRSLGSSFERLQTDFSWQQDSIFLRNLKVTHEHGTLTGKIKIQGDDIWYQAKSTLPVSVFEPFIKDGSVLDKIISNCRFSPDSLVEIEADFGTINQSDIKDWTSRGRAKLTNVSYRGVPLRSLSADYNINQIEHTYSNIEGVFDYSQYGPRRRNRTANSALVRVDRIYYDGDDRFTHIDNLRGTAWPAPLLRLFAPKAADHVEDSYRFRSPPTFVMNGKVGHDNKVSQTNVLTTVKTHSTTDYTFLDRVLNLQQLTGLVRYRHREVDVTDLRFRVFDGPVAGKIKVRTKPGSRSSFSGDIRWTRLRLAEIGKTYGFAKADQGYLTGRFADFRGVAGNVRTLDATGVIGLERGHLFFVPVLGPLSTILGGILGDKRATHEEARDASCTFTVRNGILYTKDFLTSTTSSVFTGEGSIDLHHKTIDMTIRMNARGLLGLITLPLRPFNGLFQFSGKGPLKNPTWRSASFDPPASGKNDPIFRKPGRAVVVPERRKR